MKYLNPFYFYFITEGMSYIFSSRYSFTHSFCKELEDYSRHSEAKQSVTRAFLRVYNTIDKSCGYKKTILKDYFFKKKYKNCLIVDKAKERFFPVESELINDQLSEDFFIDFVQEFCLKIIEDKELWEEKPNATLINPRVTFYDQKKENGKF